MTTVPIVDLIKAFFLEASAKTYASGEVQKTTNADLPGSKEYRYQKGGLFYVDTYFTHGERSGGQTVIFCANREWQPVWLFQYHGWCKNDDPGVLAFLKRVLADAYTKNVFFGGRGVDGYTESVGPHTLLYFNNPMGTFESGSGGESIYYDQKKVFWHTYQHYLLASE